jgi:hypothetical protein
MVGPCILKSWEFAFFDHRLRPFCQESARDVKIGFATISSRLFFGPERSPRIQSKCISRTLNSSIIAKNQETLYLAVMRNCLEVPEGGPSWFGECEGLEAGSKPMDDRV